MQTGGSSDGAAPMVTVETICVVDVRENTPVADASALEAHVNGHDENPTMTGPGVNGSKSHGMLPGGGATDGSPTRGARTMGASGKPKKKHRKAIRMSESGMNQFNKLQQKIKSSMHPKRN